MTLDSGSILSNWNLCMFCLCMCTVVPLQQNRGKLTMVYHGGKTMVNAAVIPWFMNHGMTTMVYLPVSTMVQPPWCKAPWFFDHGNTMVS